MALSLPSLSLHIHALDRLCSLPCCRVAVTSLHPGRTQVVTSIRSRRWLLLVTKVQIGGSVVGWYHTNFVTPIAIHSQRHRTN